MILHSCWIVEYGEMETQFNAKGISKMKAMLSKQEDMMRLPYGRQLVRMKRKFVFGGSTNESCVLSDPTGSRRFWMIESADKINLELVREERDQIWAEALYLYRSGSEWWLNDDEKLLMEDNNSDFESVDSWENAVINYITGKDDTTIADVLVHALNFELNRVSKTEEMRVSRILTRLGWVKKRIMKDGVQARRWLSKNHHLIEAPSETESKPLSENNTEQAKTNSVEIDKDSIIKRGSEIGRVLNSVSGALQVCEIRDLSTGQMKADFEWWHSKEVETYLEPINF